MRRGHSRLWIAVLLVAAIAIVAFAAIGCGGSTTTTTGAGTTTSVSGSTNPSTSASSTPPATEEGAGGGAPEAAAGTPVQGTVVPPGTPWLDTTKIKKPPPWNIGVSMPSLGDEWLVYFLELIKYWAAQNQNLVKNLYVTEGQANPVKQISDVKDLVTKGIDGLISVPGDASSQCRSELRIRKGHTSGAGGAHGWYRGVQCNLARR